VKVPNSHSARIEPAKIRDYLLSTVNPIGRYKSAFFTSLGYSRHAWQRLEVDLLAHLQSHEVVETQRNPYGAKYIVSGTLDGPSGVAADIIAVWIVLDGESVPRFVTAYPGED
jgi:hypothetical protein